MPGTYHNTIEVLAKKVKYVIMSAQGIALQNDNKNIPNTFFRKFGTVQIERIYTNKFELQEDIH